MTATSIVCLVGFYLVSVCAGFSLARRRHRMDLLAFTIMFPFVGLLMALYARPRCPFCHDHIYVGARVCPYCNADLVAGKPNTEVGSPSKQRICDKVNQTPSFFSSLIKWLFIMFIMLLALGIIGLAIYSKKLYSMMPEFVQDILPSFLSSSGKNSNEQPASSGDSKGKKEGFLDNLGNSVNSKIEGLKAMGRAVDATRRGDFGTVVEEGKSLVKKNVDGIKSDAKFAVGVLGAVSPGAAAATEKLGEKVENAAGTVLERARDGVKGNQQPPDTARTK